jgi:hypothetical protein
MIADTNQSQADGIACLPPPIPRKMTQLLEFKQPPAVIQVVVALLPNIAYIDQYWLL